MRSFSVSCPSWGYMGHSLNIPATVTTGTEFCLAASATMFEPLGAINPPLAWIENDTFGDEYDELYRTMVTFKPPIIWHNGIHLQGPHEQATTPYSPSP